MSKWDNVKLGDICVVERGGSPRPIQKFITEDIINGINWIKIGDTSKDSMYISKTKQKIIPEGMKKSRFVQSGDFLLSNSMSFGRPFILKIDGCIHDGWLVLRDKNNFFNKEYLYYALSSKTTYEKFKSLAVGGVVNNLNSHIVKQVEIPLPPLETQKQIALTLDIAAELVAMRNQQLAELDNLIKSTFYDMFGDPVINEKEWEIKKLSTLISKLGDGLHGTPEYSADGEYYFINGNNLNDGIISVSNKTKKVSAAEFDKYKKDLNANTMLVSINGTLGKVAFYNKEKIVLGKSACYFTVLDYVNKKYLYYILKSDYFFRYASDQATGSTIKNVSLKSMREFPIPFPPIQLQTQFATIVTKIEEQKALVKKAKDETQYLLDSLMSEYFE